MRGRNMYTRFRLLICRDLGGGKRTTQATGTTIDADSIIQGRAWANKRFAALLPMIAPSYFDLRAVRRKSKTSHVDVRGHVWTD